MSIWEIIQAGHEVNTHAEINFRENHMFHCRILLMDSVENDSSAYLWMFPSNVDELDDSPKSDLELEKCAVGQVCEYMQDRGKELKL